MVTVRLDADADPPAWFELQGRRVDVLWPPGHGLLLDPVAVIDERGEVVLLDDERREVEICATAEDDVVIFHGVP